MKKRLEQTKVYHSFSYFVWKETTHKPLKRAAAKNPFTSGYVIGATCFDECFLFYVITGRHYFSWKFIITLRLLKRHLIAFFEASILKEVRILCVISTITIWRSKVKLIKLLNFRNSFYFCNSPRFFFTNEIFFTSKSF